MKISIFTLIGLAFILICINTSHGQVFKAKREKDGKIFEYKLLESEPMNINTLFLGIDFMGLDMGPGFYMGFGLNGKYLLKETAMLHAEYFRPYFNGTDSEIEYYDNGEENELTLKLYNKFDIGGTYYFASKEGAKKEKIRLHVEHTGSVAEVTVAEHRIPTETKFGARVGYHYYQTSKGNRFKVDTLPGAFHDIYLSSFTVNSLYFGLSATKFKHYIVNSAYMGDFHSSSLRDFYFDVFLGLGGSTYFEYQRKNYESTKSYDMSRFGWRIGWEKTAIFPMTNSFGGRIGVELGKRPGPDMPQIMNLSNEKRNVDKFFFNFKVGILFSAKV